jgi:hypothetical protein
MAGLAILAAFQYAMAGIRRHLEPRSIIAFVVTLTAFVFAGITSSALQEREQLLDYWLRPTPPARKQPSTG